MNEITEKRYVYANQGAACSGQLSTASQADQQSALQELEFHLKEIRNRLNSYSLDLGNFLSRTANLDIPQTPQVDQKESLKPVLSRLETVGNITAEIKQGLDLLGARVGNLYKIS